MSLRISIAWFPRVGAGLLALSAFAYVGAAEDQCCGDNATAAAELHQRVENAASAPAPQDLVVPPAWPAQEVRRAGSGGVEAGVVATVQLGVFSDPPTDAEIILNRRFPERLAVIGNTTPEENRALVAALRAYEVAQDPAALDGFVAFLAAYPTSAWKTGLLANMGLVYNRFGYFTKAMTCWKEAWESGRQAASGDGKILADLALAELSQANAWIGREDALDELFVQAANRPMAGIAKEKLDRSRRGRDTMRKQPENSFKCGPFALDHIRKKLLPNNLAAGKWVNDFRTTPKGTTLAEINELAASFGMPMQVIKGAVGPDLPLPAVVHWKLNHFSAIMKIEDGKVLIQDTTRQQNVLTEMWLPLAAVAEEASGYFLVPVGKLPKQYAQVDADEAKFFFGRGFVSLEFDPSGTCCFDKQSGGNKKKCGMAGYAFMSMSRSLRVEDMPLFYESPRNGEIGFHVTYNEREALQPALFTCSNFGPRWSCDWIDCLMDTSGPWWGTSRIDQSLGGGGGVTHTLNNNIGTPEPFTGSTLSRSGNDFVLVHSDGSRSTYAQADSTTYPRRVFLTKVEDPSGNAVTINYQQIAAGLRLVSVVDSLGQASVFSYENADPLKITRITDPFGRQAIFSYSDGQLSSITDAVGMVSSFGYENGDVMATMTTPYGTTRFRRDTLDVFRRWIEATDPNGDTERLESVLSPPGTPYTVPIPQMEAGDLPIEFGPDSGQPLNMFCSFYWDKKAYRSSPGVYSDAVLYRWTWHDPFGGNGHHSPWGRIMSAMKPPREEVVFFQYPGQTLFTSDKDITLAKPRLVARLMDDGTTQRTRYTYSGTGQVTSTKDPLGRTTEYTYHANGIDLLEVRQRVDATTTQLLSSATYNAAHQPLTMTDAAGRGTTITYNGFGQVETVTNAKNELTRLLYNANGYLTTIRDPTLGDRTIGYDGYGRPSTVTDVDGHFTTTDFDALNRPLRVTYPDTTFEQIIYNRMDAEWLRDRQGRWTHQFHNALGRLVATRDPLGRTSFIDWCTCGKPSSLTDALGRKTSWTIDIQGRVTGKTYPDGKGVTMTYQPKSGRLNTVTDAMGQITTYQYFLDDQVQSVAYTSAARPTPGVSFTYDALFGRLATMVDGTGTTTYAYHPITAAPTTPGAGRLASVDGPLANDTVGFAYDELGRVLNRSLGLGATAGSYAQAVTYDNLGRVATQTNELGSFIYTYVGKTGRLNDVTLPGGMKTTLAYQAMNQDFRLSSITHTRTGGALISSHAYTYSPAGAITSWAMQTDVDGSSTFQFANDEADQLQSAVRTGTIPTGAPAVSSFRYDAAGNRLTTQLDKVVQTHSYNNINQLTGTTAGGLLRVEGRLDELATVTVNGVNAKVTADKKYVAEVPVTTGNNTLTVRATDANNNVQQKQWQITGITGMAASPTYDFNGNTTFDGTRTFEWDAKDRLTAIVIGTSRSEFTYDGLGRRVRIVEKTGGTVTSDKRFMWAGAEIVQERESSTNAVAKRFSGHGVLGATGVLLYLRDHLGSVREAMDTTGVVRARYDYEVYGKRLKIRGDLEVDAGFTGHWQHGASGLALTWFRAYDPVNGRWVNRDPIERSKLYSYSSNSPISRYDLFGGPDEYFDVALSGDPQAEGGGVAQAVGDVDLSVPWCTTIPEFASKLEKGMKARTKVTLRIFGHGNESGVLTGAHAITQNNLTTAFSKMVAGKMTAMVLTSCNRDRGALAKDPNAAKAADEKRRNLLRTIHKTFNIPVVGTVGVSSGRGGTPAEENSSIFGINSDGTENSFPPTPAGSAQAQQWAFGK
jgi:RHS repeat-associated protein